MNAPLVPSPHRSPRVPTCLPPNDRVLLFPDPLQIHLARIVGDRRYRGHGPEALRRDRFGALAEILMLDALFAAGLYPTDFCLLADQPIPEPDFYMYGSTWDIKTIPPPPRSAQQRGRDRYLCINQEDHETHAPDFYLPTAFCHRPEGLCLEVFCAVPAVDVWSWRPMRNRHKPYRSKSIRTFSPLLSLDDLEGGHRK